MPTLPPQLPLGGSHGMPFVRSSVEQLVIPGTLGVYALYKNPGQFPLWVFVGKGYIRAHLLAHLNGNVRCITREAPTHFTFEEIEDIERVDARAQELIGELKPICNALSL
jgi:hypothetical protein